MAKQEETVRIRITMPHHDPDAEKKGQYFGVYSSAHERDLTHGEVVDVEKFFGHELVGSKRAEFVDEQTSRPLTTDSIQSRDPKASRTR